MEPSQTWMDLTLRPESEVEVELEPDNTVEFSWTLPGDGRATLLLTPDNAAKLNDRLGMLLLLVER